MLYSCTHMATMGVKGLSPLHGYSQLVDGRFTTTKPMWRTPTITDSVVRGQGQKQTGTCALLCPPTLTTDRISSI